MCPLLREGLQDAVQLVVGFKPDAGNSWQLNVTVFNRDTVRESAERLEDARVGLIAAQAETSRDVERHLVTAMRDTARGRPAVTLQHFQNAQVFH